MFSPVFHLCTRICGKLVAGLFSCLFVPYTTIRNKDLNFWDGLLDKLNLIKVQAVWARGGGEKQGRISILLYETTYKHLWYRLCFVCIFNL